MLFIYSTETRSQRISVQLQDARDKFTQIAESHATALQVTFIITLQYMNKHNNHLLCYKIFFY